MDSKLGTVAVIRGEEVFMIPDPEGVEGLSLDVQRGLRAVIESAVAGVCPECGAKRSPIPPKAKKTDTARSVPLAHVPGCVAVCEEVRDVSAAWKAAGGGSNAAFLTARQIRAGRRNG